MDPNHRLPPDFRNHSLYCTGWSPSRPVGRQGAIYNAAGLPSLIPCFICKGHTPRPGHFHEPVISRGGVLPSAARESRKPPRLGSASSGPSSCALGKARKARVSGKDEGATAPSLGGAGTLAFRLNPCGAKFLLTAPWSLRI